MKKMKVVWTAVLLMALLIGSVLNAGAEASSGLAGTIQKGIEAEAACAIVGMSAEQSQLTALQRARAAAIEQAAGVSVTAATLVTNFTLAADFIKTYSRGFIVAEKVTWLPLGQYQKDPQSPPIPEYRVKIVADVFIPKQKAKTLGLAARLNNKVFRAGEKAQVTIHSKTATEGALADSVTGMQFVFVKGGCYQMGDTFGDGSSDEKPVHEVCVSDFYMGKYEVTVGQFLKFVNDSSYQTEAEKGDGCYIWTGSTWCKQRDKNWRNPGFSQTDNHPVACVSWNDAQEFIKWQSRKSSKKYRLPTEAEWEYAARSGGISEKYAGGAELDAVAWYRANSGSKTHPVGQKQPNGLELFDMSGNVWEWCSDWYGEKYYKDSPRSNPGGPSFGSYRVYRGGGWGHNAANARAANRIRYYPAVRLDYLGFRLVLPAGQ